MLTPMLLLMACSKSDDAQPVPEVQTGKMTKELIVNGTTREYIFYADTHPIAYGMF